MEFKYSRVIEVDIYLGRIRLPRPMILAKQEYLRMEPMEKSKNNNNKTHTYTHTHVDQGGFVNAGWSKNPMTLLCRPNYNHILLETARLAHPVT